MAQPVRTVHIITKANDPAAATLGAEISDWLGARGVAAKTQENRTAPGPDDLAAQPGADLILVLGGDGTMLSVARRALCCPTPVLGLKQGRLGFLTEMYSEDWPEKLAALLARGIRVSHRMVLAYAVERGGKVVGEGAVVNDLVVNRGGMARLISVDLWTGEGEAAQDLGAVRADGIIVSTPTGATGYSVSAGGPLVHPNLGVYTVTPICPFLHTMRPLVLPDSLPLTMVMQETASDLFLTADGQEGEELHPGDRVVVRRAPQDFCLAVLDESYFDKLKAKGFMNDHTIPENRR